MLMFVKEDKNTKQQLFSTLKKNDKFSVTEEHRNKLHFKTYYNRNHFNYNDTYNILVFLIKQMQPWWA